MANAIPEIATNKIVIVTNIVTHDVTGLDVVNSVNQLYSGMFGHFLIMLGIIATIVGVVIPILLQRNQMREGQLQEERLNASFKEQIEEAKRSADLKIAKLEQEKAAIEKIIKDTEDRTEKNLANIRGSISHTDALASAAKNDPLQAVKLAISGARQYLKGDEKGNVPPIITLTVNSLNKLNKNQIAEAGLEESLSKLEAELKASTGKISPVKLSEFVKAKESALARNK